MREDRLFPEGTIPEYTKAAWYAERESAPHVDQDAHRPRLELAADMVRAIYEPHMTVVDLGSGDGGLLWLISPFVHPDKRWGYDLQQSNVDAAAARGQDVRYGDVLAGDVVYGDIGVSTEMIEHLVDPHAYLRDLATKVTYIVASSPFTESAEAHYEFHTWAWDVEGYAAMFAGNGWAVVRQETVGAFQVLLAKSSLV